MPRPPARDLTQPERGPPCYTMPVLSAHRARLLALVAAATLVGCASRAESSATPGGQNSRTQADRYTAKAVRRSPEGFILIPSKKAERAFDQARLTELAQDMRAPAAACFLNRAIETMKPRREDGEITYEGVPEGQAKIRVRIAPSGEVLRAEILETGFGDPVLEGCLTDLLQTTRWPANRTGNIQWIDVVYWVSLGFQADDTSPEAAHEFRRQQAFAAVRGKRCFDSRVAPGRYRVEGLSLLDRDGTTLVNRVEPNDLPPQTSQCLTIALRELRMPRSPEAFIRPFSPAIEFEVKAGGAVSFADERWIELIALEEAAEREAKRAELSGEQPAPRTFGVDEGEPPEGEGEAAAAVHADATATPAEAGPPAAKVPVPPAAKVPSPPAAKAPPGGDPGKGGLRLDLGGRGGRPGS